MNPLAEIIAGEIAARRAIPFARFMELALYCPVYGYYEKEADTIGRAGDFITSVSIGSLFGELLACQFADWLETLSRARGDSPHDPRPHLQLVEAGAHHGQLARDILAWLRAHRPALFSRLEYWILEPSEDRWTRQRRTLADFAAKIRRAARIDEVSAASSGGGIAGVFFSNELLDAMPVRRFGWDAARREWFEWGVALREGGLVWTRLALPPGGSGPGGPIAVALEALAGFSQLPPELAAILPDGFVLEHGAAAVEWWRAAARALRHGKLMTIDYGFAAGEGFRPERTQGTLRAYSQQHVHENLLANPGDQDLTAHVPFAAVQAAGEAAALKTEMLVSQSKFLAAIAERIWMGAADFGDWTPARLRQFQALTHPEHLGRPFRVLVQSRSEQAARSTAG